MENEKPIAIAETILSLHNNSNEMSASNRPNCYIYAATSQNTRKAYQADIRHFIHWGGRLPTSGDVIL